MIQRIFKARSRRLQAEKADIAKVSVIAWRTHRGVVNALDTLIESNAPYSLLHAGATENLTYYSLQEQRLGFCARRTVTCTPQYYEAVLRTFETYQRHYDRTTNG